MFTGIIEEVGKIKSVIGNRESSRLAIYASKVLENTKVGDSISTNGVCLTVTSIHNNYFEADVMHETLLRSNLGELKTQDKVNLERALLVNERFGGHIVSGHIDGTGVIKDISKDGISVILTISAPKEILKYIIEKGSIAIDGVSLTVISACENIFKVGIIPHTGVNTILLDKVVSDKVNLENDLIGKYVEKLINFKDEKENKSNINKDFLRINGFM